MDSQDRIRQRVRHQYARVAQSGLCGCTPGCCTPSATGTPLSAAGYAEPDAMTASIWMGLGCGNPRAIARLKSGETVLDLGCGGGFDCFLAARQVGATGHVIGIDMTEQMISRARDNAAKLRLPQVEFRQSEMEHLPLGDACVDVIISNCAINLSPDKAGVFREAWRILKPGGRLAVSDIVAINEMPASLRDNETLHTSCIAGAELIANLEAMLVSAGFEKVVITPHEASRSLIRDWAPDLPVADYVIAADIEALTSSPPSRLWLAALKSGKEGDSYRVQPKVGWITSASSCFIERPDCTGSPQTKTRCPRAKILIAPTTSALFS